MARVLIVDDSAVARKTLAGILSELGHQVVGEAASGSAAFVEYLRLRPGLVTMDLNMPGMGGLSALAKIVATFPDARVIVISANEGKATILEALEKGARHFIIKPINREKVASVVTSVLQQEFNRQRHQEIVKRLRDSDNALTPPLRVEPPFQISCQDGMTVVEISGSFSLNSCASLNLEIEEHLDKDRPRILLDFGETASMNEEVLTAIDAFIGYVEERTGQVRAVCCNPRFAQTVCDTEPTPRLSAVLRTLNLRVRQ